MKESLLFEQFTPLTKPISKRNSADLRKLAKKNRELEKERQRTEERERAQLRKPVIRHMIHKPTYCVLTWRNEKDEPIPRNKHTLSSFKKKNEVMSTQSISGLKQGLNWLYVFADKKRVYSKVPWLNKKGEECHNFTFRLAFITLTLSAKQFHTDEQIKDLMLKPFLHWLTRSYKSSYVWKAETQLNGNIHFHVTIDTFIHWRSVRAKWNGLLAAQGYCKVFQDGTNDKGNSATQIKAIKNEKGHAGIVGGYLTKGSIEEKEHYRLKTKQEIESGKSVQYYDHQAKEWKEKITIDELLLNSEGISQNIETKKHYTRFVEGRLWSQSASISSVDLFMSDVDTNLLQVEGDFFKSNTPKRLSTVMINEQKKKLVGVPENERIIMGNDDLSLEKRYLSYSNVFIHKNLKSCRLPDELSKKLLEEKNNRTFNTQRSFTVESLV